MPTRPDAPHPAALGLVRRVAGVLALPILGAALLLWRSDALQAQELAALRASDATMDAALASHVEADQRALNERVASDRESAVAMARLHAAVDAAGRSADALLIALSRRR